MTKRSSRKVGSYVLWQVMEKEWKMELGEGERPTPQQVADAFDAADFQDCAAIASTKMNSQTSSHSDALLLACLVSHWLP